MGKKKEPIKGIFKRIAKYALFKYGDEFIENASKCPYETRMGGDLAFQQELLWFMYQWKNPHTGTTILEEFVAENVTGKEAVKILRRKEITYDEFVVTKTGESGTITIRGTNTQTEYVMVCPSPADQYHEGRVFMGRIYPRKDSHKNDLYVACGPLVTPGEWDDETIIAHLNSEGATDELIKKTMDIFHFFASARTGPGRTPAEIIGMCRLLGDYKSSDDLRFPISLDHTKDVMARDMATKAVWSTPISSHTSLKPVLDAYTDEFLYTICFESNIGTLKERDIMIRRICDMVPITMREQISKISNPERDLLKYILARDLVPMSDLYDAMGPLLTKYFMEEDMRFLGRYIKEPPEEGKYDPDDVDTVVDIFIIHAILLAGTANVNGRRQRVVTIARELREQILEQLKEATYDEDDDSTTPERIDAR